MKPYEILPEKIEHDGKTYRLDLSYAAVFAAADALADERLTPDIKLRTALEILVPVKHPDDPKLLTAILLESMKVSPVTSIRSILPACAAASSMTLRRYRSLP